VPIAAAMLIASAYGFSRDDAKIASTDYFFTGFPSYWNIVCAYMYLWQTPPLVNALVLAALAVLVFVPIRYVYPSRTETWRPATLILGTTWAASIVWVIWRLPASGGPWLWFSLVFPVYYIALSLKLSAAERLQPARSVETLPHRMDG
jgi:phosphatidylcholine synthase